MNTTPEIKIDQLIRSKRRTISFAINENGEFIVKAPFRASLKYIQTLVCKKSSWILKKQNEIITTKKNFKPKNFFDGELFLHLGKEYELKIVSDKKNKNIFLAEYLHFPEHFLPQAKKYLIYWYKKEACKIITEKANHFGKISSLKPKSIKINNAKKRWGSCGPSNSLNFSWMLILAPIEVVEYVVVHELAHIKEKNHSQSFWQTVTQIMPNFKAYETWLKKNGKMLLREAETVQGVE